MSYAALTLIGPSFLLFPPPPKDNAWNEKESLQRRNMYSLFVKLSRVMGRNTVFHKENSYKEDFSLRDLPPFPGIQNVPDIPTFLKG